MANDFIGNVSNTTTRWAVDQLSNLWAIPYSAWDIADKLAVKMGKEPVEVVRLALHEGFKVLIQKSKIQTVKDTSK